MWSVHLKAPNLPLWHDGDQPVFRSTAYSEQKGYAPTISVRSKAFVIFISYRRAASEPF